MQWLPTLIGAVLAIGLVITAFSLFRHHQHPQRILQHSLSAATVLAVISLVGAVPAALWWAPWVAAAVLVGGVAVSCRRLLVSDPPADPSPREAARLQAPRARALGTEAVGCLVLLGIALVAG